MYEKIINLIIRINADVTLSDAAKNAIVELVETCTTEKEVIEMEKLLDMYAAHTEKIVETALARKTPEELKDINNAMSRMTKGARSTIENFVCKNDKADAQDVILSF